MTAPLFTKSQAAAYLNVSVKTIDRLSKARKLRFSYVSGRRRYRPEDIDAYLNSHSFGPGQSSTIGVSA